MIHATYKPIPGRFKDYIAMSKANNYQSLHTTVIGPHGERVEIQIRTQEMHEVAEKGIAAHWRYKEGRFGTQSNRDGVEWVQRLLDWHKELKDPNEFLETVKIDLFAEDVFVFTPNGEVKELPHGATPLDFAYSVHTDVGHKCVGAKVNGKIVPLKHRLNSGDTIEVLTSPSQTPSKDWLKIVRSSRAKAKIRAYIKLQERTRALSLGRDIFEKTLRQYEFSVKSMEKADTFLPLAQKFGCANADDLFVAIGYGRILPESLIKEVVPKDKVEAKATQGRAEDESFLKRVFTAAKRRSEARNAITVDNLDDVLIRFARCCNPLPGDGIAGFITRGRGVTIHTATCPKAIDSDQDRRVPVRWNDRNAPDGKAAKLKRHVQIRVLSLDEPGLLALMSQTIAACSVNIASAQIRTTKDKKAIAVFDIEVSDLTQLQKVVNSLEGKKGVIAVERVRS